MDEVALSAKRSFVSFEINLLFVGWRSRDLALCISVSRFVFAKYPAVMTSLKDKVERLENFVELARTIADEIRIQFAGPKPFDTLLLILYQLFRPFPSTGRFSLAITIIWLQFSRYHAHAELSTSCLGRKEFH